ncbi:plasmid partitioning protein RepB C-terminal domain-containing protein [Thioclava sp. GXIMD4216]|uniref:plasmid partitioning protein RepB C-terminal domain-containing protein n=1 Tax=Thioclava sp. GXIMD4216 TaxID=3131929 RepID=UPI0030D1F8DD
MTDTLPPPTVKLGFEPETLLLRLDQILTLKPLRPETKESSKYKQILGSVKAVGLVEAPVVARHPKDGNRFFLLDGALRIEALKDLGQTRVECLISTDDETYTYNKRINRLPPIQEHKMIKRAIARGVPEAAIATALGLDIKSILRRSRLLEGICTEAAELLRAASCPMASFDILRKMVPLRQIEAAELMLGQNNFSSGFAKALLAATPDHHLAQRRRKPAGSDGQAITATALAHMERELLNLQTKIRTFEDSFGMDTLHLTLARGYLRKLLATPEIVQWLAQNRKEYLSEFRTLLDANRIS